MNGTRQEIEKIWDLTYSKNTVDVLTWEVISEEPISLTQLMDIFWVTSLAVIDILERKGKMAMFNPNTNSYEY